MSLHEELTELCSVLKNATAREGVARLSHILSWMDGQPDVKKVLDELRGDSVIINMVQSAAARTPPLPVTPKQIAGVGLALIEASAKRKEPLAIIAMQWGVVSGGSKSLSIVNDEVMRRYVVPFLGFVLERLPGKPLATGTSNLPVLPVAIQESLEAFRKDHADAEKTCFIMMQFSETGAHGLIEQTIKAILLEFDFTGLLARDKQYHDDLYPNIQTYMHGCRFGIAVFERIEKDDFNPNVSLEIGYMLGLKKPVLLLKEKTLTSLQSDLVGKLYHPFDVQNVPKTIPGQIKRWMEDKTFF